MNSLAFYTGVGGQQTLNVPFQYIDRDHVKVYQNGVQVSVTWPTSSTVRIANSVAGAAIKVARETPADAPLVEFGPTANVGSTELNISATQALFVAQEAQDKISLVLTLGASTFFDAEGRRIASLGSPIDPMDAATKAYVDQVATTPGPVGPAGPQGIQGVPGDQGPGFLPDAVGVLSGRSTYDNAATNFSYFATDTALVYFKTSASPGAWSGGVPISKGDKGDTGAQGPAGLNWRGKWNAGVLYAVNDAVYDTNAGGSYRCISGHAGQSVTNTTYWTPLALKGPQGIQGPPGIPGAPGANGIDGAPGAPGATGPKGNFDICMDPSPANLVFPIGQYLVAWTEYGNDAGTHATLYRSLAGYTGQYSAGSQGYRDEDQPLSGVWRLCSYFGSYQGLWQRIS